MGCLLYTSMAMKWPFSKPLTKNYQTTSLSTLEQVMTIS